MDYLFQTDSLTQLQLKWLVLKLFSLVVICYSFTTVGGINYNALFLPRFPWTKLCLHGHNLPNTSSYEKDGNFPYPTVFSGSYLIIGNVIETPVLTCEEGEEEREPYSMVNSCHTGAFYSCYRCIQTGAASPVRRARFLWGSLAEGDACWHLLLHFIP